MNRIFSNLLVSLIILTCGCLSPMAAKESANREVTVEYLLTPPPHCQNCINKIKGNLRFEKGVKNIEVDLEKKTVAIKYSPKATNENKLIEALKKIGYTASTFNGEKQEYEQCSECEK